MKNVKPVAALALCGLVFGAYGWGHAQGQAEGRMSRDDFRKVQSTVEDKGSAENYAALSQAYKDAPGNSEVVREIVEDALSADYRGKTNNTRLVALQVMQNERIIALLEAQQKGK